MHRPKLRLIAALAAVLVLVTGLLLARGQDGVPGSASASARRVIVDTVTEKPVSWDRRLTGRDGGYSVPLGDRASMWVFGDSCLAAEGSHCTRWRNNTLAITGDRDASDGLTLGEPAGWEHEGGAGEPSEYLPLSPGEEYLNDRQAPGNCAAGERHCGRQIALWPGPAVADPMGERVLFFLDSIIRGGDVGEQDFIGWGRGVAEFDRAEGFRRLETGTPPGGEPWDRWSLFGAGSGEVLYGSGTVVRGKYLYSLGCAEADGQWLRRCSSARVPLADVHRRAAWQYYAGRQRWSADPRDAVTVVRAAVHQSVHYNAYLGAYLLIDGGQDAFHRTAPRPWGPWSARKLLFRTEPSVCEPGDKWCYNYFVLAHPEYSRDGGRTSYVSYTRRTPQSPGGELRLAEVRFR